MARGGPGEGQDRSLGQRPLEEVPPRFGQSELLPVPACDHQPDAVRRVQDPLLLLRSEKDKIGPVANVRSRRSHPASGSRSSLPSLPATINRMPFGVYRIRCSFSSRTTIIGRADQIRPRQISRRTMGSPVRKWRTRGYDARRAAKATFAAASSSSALPRRAATSSKSVEAAASSLSAAALIWTLRSEEHTSEL